MTTGRVGAPLTINDFMLVSWVEGNYSIADKPYPRGEIIIGKFGHICLLFYIKLHNNYCFLFLFLGGDNVSPGYYKNPEKTKEEFFYKDDKWWFKSGDIAELHDDGVIKIIGKSYFFKII